MGKRPIEDWLAQNLRVTLFPAETDWNINSAQVWWESAFGDQPDSRNLSPKLKNLEDEGAYAGGRVRLSVQRPRIDWLFTAPQVSPEEEPRWGIGPFVPSLDDFVGPIMKWLENAPPATRLAFGAVVILAVPDLQTGYLQLRPYLPCVTLDPEGGQNFFYQINRRRRSAVLKDLTINRLANWSVAAFTNGQLLLSPGSASMVTEAKEFGCVVQLDINSVPEYTGSLKTDVLPRLFQEFVKLAHEIIAEGDIP